MSKTGRTTATAGRFGAEGLRRLEAELSEPLFMSAPVGSTLDSLYMTRLYSQRGEPLWRRLVRLHDILRVYRRVRPLRGTGPAKALPEGGIIVCLSSMNFRSRDLVVPVFERLDADKAVLVLGAGRPDLARLPAGRDVRRADELLRLDGGAWRSEFRRFWKQWRPRLRRVLGELKAPSGLYPLLARMAVVQTQRLAGFREFLSRSRPAAILVEFDRHPIWSCLVLAAKTLGVPTYTMIHGVINEGAVGYAPLLADKAFCWGRTDRNKLVEAGVGPDRLIAGGCPRVTRGLPAGPAEARARVGLDVGKPVVMLGTAPYGLDDCRRFALVFCEALAGREDLSAIVRLHPSERLSSYEGVIQKYPSVRFLSNAEMTLDESLAASEVVVVHSSGLGSDALVKRRLAVVLDVLDRPLGHGRDLIDQAGAPRAGSAEELAKIVDRILAAPGERDRLAAAAEAFVGRMFAAFGSEAAGRIADRIQEDLAGRG